MRRAAGADGPPAGRPPLSERRKAATRREIALEAVRLFADKGLAATTGEEIARAAGISPRTLWRYFAAKEQCAEPLLTAGLDAMARLLREWPADRPLLAAFDDVEWCAAFETEDTAILRELVCLARSEPALRLVWFKVHQDAEEVFAEIIARRTGRSADDLEPRTQAAMLNGALRIAAEEWARRPEESGEFPRSTVVRRTLRTAATGLSL
ncbi:TetR family transcriptional regulator [Spinactinospora alkalitolerans]